MGGGAAGSDSPEGGKAGSNGTGGSEVGGAAMPPPSEVEDLLVLQCPAEPAVFDAPTARLSMREYRRTLADLFKGVTLPTLTLPTDTKVGGYDALVAQQSASSGYMDAFHESAKSIAVTAMAARDQWSGCVANQDGKACGYAIITNFGKRALRRPLDAQESTRYRAFFDDAFTKYGAPVAQRMLVEAFLQSPGFLYRIETGATSVTPSGESKLSSWEMASRLSFLLVDSMPDAELFAAAEDGSLADSAGLEKEVRRLLATTTARFSVAHFQEQWLELDKIADLNKTADVMVGFSSLTTAKLRTATDRFVDHAFWESGSLTSLLTENKAYVDSTLGPLYGNTNGTAVLSLQEVPATQRAGLLSQVGMLAALATDTRSSPIFRGVFVLDRLLCAAPPPPPADALTAPMRPGTVVTTRDKFEIAHGGPTCAGCHTLIDGIGFAMENYDAVGRWRDTENGAPINASGKIEGLSPEIDGAFDGAVALSERLARSARTRDCVTANWAAYATGTIRDELNACTLQPIVRKFADGKLDMRELLVAIATSPSFRSIKSPTP
jgi:Protein of unknown function (DUF1592)/Protein of unknown function (DUF1588)/Protein of unknown function (DUF1595)/Protein of unknown function (DUF1585)/Protein of unknown function (DUF1587)